MIACHHRRDTALIVASMNMGSWRDLLKEAERRLRTVLALPRRGGHTADRIGSRATGYGVSLFWRSCRQDAKSGKSQIG